jgi:hypothetical protein
VKQLHIILLVISLACMALFVMALYRPYARRLHRDSKAVAGLLSQLPAEVDVEGHVKTVVLGIVRSSGAASLTAGFASMAAPSGMPNSSTGGMMAGAPPGAYGMAAPAMMPPIGAPAAAYGWQGRGGIGVPGVPGMRQGGAAGGVGGW